jgi:hypothetical protein
MTTTDQKLTATQARAFAKRILAETLFTDVKAKKGWDGWEINIDGGARGLLRPHDPIRRFRRGHPQHLRQLA